MNGFVCDVGGFRFVVGVFVDGVVGHVVEEYGAVGFCVFRLKFARFALNRSVSGVLTEPEIEFYGNAGLTGADIEGVFCPF